MRTLSGNLATGYFAALAAAVALYVATCAPGPVWQDSGMIQYRVWHNDIEGGLGLALSHPLFYIIAIGAKHIPLGEVAYKVNLVGAVAAAVAVANLFLFLRLLCGVNLPAVIGAMTLALSHTFWQHATMPETYNLYAAILIAELIMVLQYGRTGRVGYLYWLGLLNGLSIADHMLGSIAFACYAVFIAVLLSKKKVGFKNIVIIVLLWVVGALPYEYLIVKNIVRTGDLAGVLASAAFGASWQKNVLNVSMSMRIVKENVLFLLMNFPTPNILLFFAGFWGLKKAAPTVAFRNIILGLMILFLLFAFRYTIADRYAFFIPFYCFVAVLIGLGFWQFSIRYKNAAIAYLVIAFAMLNIPAYIAAPIVAESRKVDIGMKREIPYRNAYKFFLQPWRTGYDGAERFAASALGEVEHDAIIQADNTTVYPLLYAQEIKGIRNDVGIVSGLVSSPNASVLDEKTVPELLKHRNVYVVSPVAGYCPKFLLEQYSFEKKGVLWRICGRKES